jgi:hypothetical protein
VLKALHKCVKEHCLIAFPTEDNTEDTRPSGFSNDQLHVLKTYPILDSNQLPIPLTNEQRNSILIQNLHSTKDRINRMEYRANDDSTIFW